METYHIVSSNIDAVAYHRGHTLIRFKSGGVYEYENTPYHQFLELAKSESAGQYFHRHFRGKFPYRKISDESRAK